ncbi:BTAD domain-containing putative transcriptional regulator [Streptomyces sp. NPDC001796]|uniref:AfsR/SARP family transcriptional regulator n=1 Tax=Streptomyces sp. NPDC001796 TaxID=3364609 RepID=UPI0036A1C62F
MNGVSIVPSAGKPRQVLALLAIRAGQIVPVTTLMEEVWGDDLPRSAVTTLQTYILQLRRKIVSTLPAEAGASAKDILSTRFGGYSIGVRPDVCDLREFEQLAARGMTALEAGDARSASSLLGQALSLWRGNALMDVPMGRVLEMETLGIQEARMRVLEQRIKADLQLGRHAELLAELRVLTTQHPLHETFAGNLMLAFYRSGAVWRALEVFQQLRRTLDDELGIVPSPRLQQLHQAILVGDPALDAPQYTADAALPLVAA